MHKKNDGSTLSQFDYTYNSDGLRSQVSKTLYTYNANDSRFTKTTNGSVTSYRYDFDEQLVQVVSPVTGTSDFTYDGLGRRVGRTAGGVTTTFYYSGSRITTEAQGSAVTAHYVYGVNRVSRDASGSFEYYHADGLGSTRQLSNDGQSLTQTTTYDAFGNIESSAGSSNNVYKYAGQWGYRSDGDDGLMHVGARYYDPLTRRFLQADTWLGEIARPQSLNRYNYCEGDPVNHVDPTGRWVYALLRVSTAIGGRPPWLTPRPTPPPRVSGPPLRRLLPPQKGDTLTPKDLAEMAKSPEGKAIEFVEESQGLRAGKPFTYSTVPGGPPTGFEGGSSDGGNDPLHPPPLIA